MVGTLTDKYEWAKYNPIGWWYKPWFYKHAEVRSADWSTVCRTVRTVDHCMAAP